jgi:universal stress protein A
MNEPHLRETMPLFKEILCAIDFGTDYLSALRLGRRLAQRNGARMSLIYVMTPQTPGGVIMPKDKATARAKLETVAREELNGIDYQMIVRWGNPVKEIVAAEAEFKVDLCVIPNRGHMGTSHLFRRSIAERLARESPCPVLTVSTNGGVS